MINVVDCYLKAETDHLCKLHFRSLSMSIYLAPEICVLENSMVLKLLWLLKCCNKMLFSLRPVYYLGLKIFISLNVVLHTQFYF